MSTRANMMELQRRSLFFCMNVSGCALATSGSRSMFLSSWLKSFHQAVRQSMSPSLSRCRSRKQYRSGRTTKIEALESRALLTPPIITPTARPGSTGTGSFPPYIISHSSTFSNEPNGLDGTEIAVRLRDVDFLLIRRSFCRRQ